MSYCCTVEILGGELDSKITNSYNVQLVVVKMCTGM